LQELASPASQTGETSGKVRNEVNLFDAKNFKRLPIDSLAKNFKIVTTLVRCTAPSPPHDSDRVSALLENFGSSSLFNLSVEIFF
jgi:hypothetical protein